MKETALIEVFGIQSGKILGLLMLISIFVLTLYYLTRERPPFVRRVPALDAIEDGVGRSTEMGKAVMMNYGSGGFQYSTIAALSILSFTARLCAERETRLVVPTGGSRQALIVRPVGVDIVRTAYRLAGKGELFNEDDVPFLSVDTFPMGAGVAGMLLSNRPGLFLLAGQLWADSMMQAEASNQAGAITITSALSLGYASVLACASDYIMIAEEAMVASAYLSKDPGQLGSIRVQDIFKYLVMILVFVNLLLAQLGSSILLDILST